MEAGGGQQGEAQTELPGGPAPLSQGDQGHHKEEERAQMHQGAEGKGGQVEAEAEEDHPGHCAVMGVGDHRHGSADRKRHD